MKHSVAGISIDGQRIFIAKRISRGDMGGRWEFPGGKVEQGEAFQDALAREYAEEFSWSVRVGDLITEAEFTHNGEAVKLHAYEVFLPGELPAPVFTEHSEVIWCQISDIRGLSFVDSDLKLLPGIETWFGN